MRKLILAMTLMISSNVFAESGPGGAYETYDKTIRYIMGVRDNVAKELLQVAQSDINLLFPVKLIDRDKLVAVLMNLKMNVECERKRPDENGVWRHMILDFGPRTGKKLESGSECESYNDPFYIEVLKRFYQKVENKIFESSDIRSYLVHEALHHFDYLTEDESWAATHLLLELATDYVPGGTNVLPGYRLLSTPELKMEAYNLIKRATIGGSQDNFDIVLIGGNHKKFDNSVKISFYKYSGRRLTIKGESSRYAYDFNVDKFTCAEDSASFTCHEQYYPSMPFPTPLLQVMVPSARGVMFRGSGVEDIILNTAVKYWVRD